MTILIKKHVNKNNQANLKILRHNKKKKFEDKDKKK